MSFTQCKQPASRAATLTIVQTNADEAKKPPLPKAERTGATGYVFKALFPELTIPRPKRQHQVIRAQKLRSLTQAEASDILLELKRAIALLIGPNKPKDAGEAAAVDAKVNAPSVSFQFVEGIIERIILTRLGFSAFLNRSQLIQIFFQLNSANLLDEAMLIRFTENLITDRKDHYTRNVDDEMLRLFDAKQVLKLEEAEEDYMISNRGLFKDDETHQYYNYIKKILAPLIQCGIKLTADDISALIAIIKNGKLMETDKTNIFFQIASVFEMCQKAGILKQENFRDIIQNVITVFVVNPYSYIQDRVRNLYYEDRLNEEALKTLFAEMGVIRLPDENSAFRIERSEPKPAQVSPSAPARTP